MSPNSRHFQDWIDKAENDLKAAEAIVNYYEEPPTDTSCYHCHQVAEKSLKAYLIYNKTSPPRVHDLIELINLCAAKNSIVDQLKKAASILNRYYIEAKYPPDEPFLYPVNEAREALELASQILQFVKNQTRLT